jgi:hypothetical protein
MRIPPAFTPAIFTSIICLAVASCDQRPLDVVPETTTGKWQTLYDLETEYYGDVDGISSSDLYGVASESGLIHYNGAVWRELGSPNGVSLRALSVVSAGEIYAVGGKGAFRFDGAAWTEFYNGGVVPLDVWTQDGSGVFVAFYGGSFPGPLRGGVLRFDQSLALVDSVYKGYSTTAVWGSSQSDVFAVGYHDSILHFDGSGWTSFGFEGYPSLSDVHGVGPNEVYAVGPRTPLLKYDGNQWTSIELPEQLSGFSSVWAAASDDVYLLYSLGGIAHYNGTGFELLNSSTGQQLIAAWGESPDDIFAVGANKKVVRFDGAEWMSVSGGLPDRAMFLWGIDSKNIYIADIYTVFRYDGATIEELPRADVETPVSAMWGTSADDLTSVGRGGAIFEFDGSQWSRAVSSTTVDLHAVTGSGGGPIFAVGDGRTVVRNEGSGWVLIKEDPVSGVAYRDAWSSGGMLYAVGEQGSASRFNGVVWESLPTGVNDDLLSVWGTAADNVYAAGAGTVIRFDGTTWSREVLDGYVNRPWTYRHLTGSGWDDVFLAAEGSRLYRFNGELWSPLESEFGDYFVDLWTDENGELYAAGLREPRLAVWRW